MTKIDLITGLLGSGKTTFLLSYAKYLISRGMRIAILVNDFGAVNVDMIMLHELKGESCQLEMIAGTADPCCHKRRFKTQLISLGMQHFDRVIVEPSGIFDIDEFFDLLHESPLDSWFSIGSMIGIIDSGTEERLTEQMEYLLASEAACCGKLIASKVNTDAPEEIALLKNDLIRHVNRSLSDIRCDRVFSEDDLVIWKGTGLSDEDCEKLMSVGYRSSSYIKKFSPEDIMSSVHYFMHVELPAEMINDIIQGIMNDAECGRIFRIKGSVPADGGGWLRINATAESTELSPVSAGQPVLIVIGDDIDRGKIDEHLRKYNIDPEYVSI